MHLIIRKPWQLPQRLHTPEEVYAARRQHRRDFLASLGWSAAAAGAALLLPGCHRGTDEEVTQAGKYDPVLPAPATDTERTDALEKGVADAEAKIPEAPRDERFDYGRAETAEAEAARYTNFYEFTMTKASWRYVGAFSPLPWSIEVDGLCAKPRTFDFDELSTLFSLEERHYRHRCVETWAMCVPWIGFPLRDLLALVEPLPGARFVAFQTFDRPDESPNMRESPHYPWPYTEGLTIAEAMNELAFIATGMYGHMLLKQHGAPVRLVVPWKYGFKSIKSIVRITLAETAPPTFWNTVQPHEYDFEANVNPDIPHPRWSQRMEWMLGTGEKFPTVIYNGYGEYVGGLYPA